MFPLLFLGILRLRVEGLRFRCFRLRVWALPSRFGSRFARTSCVSLGRSRFSALPLLFLAMGPDNFGKEGMPVAQGPLPRPSNVVVLVRVLTKFG